MIGGGFRGDARCAMGRRRTRPLDGTLHPKQLREQRHIL
jgi:hypothetical protein